MTASPSFSTNQFSLNNKIAFVTGASSGIGATVAKALAGAGAKVVVGARRRDRLETLVSEINQSANANVAIAADVDVIDRESIKKAFDLAEENYGTPDIIINNAGVASPATFVKDTEKSRDFVLNTNVNGVWNVAQEGAQRMIAKKIPGSIINIASILGLTVKPGQTSYCASKGAVIQLTRAMALDLMRHNIRVNAIAPGWYKTEMNEAYFDSPAGKNFIENMPAKRLGKLEELVGPIVMLSGDTASFINGTVIPVDGAISVAGI
ncbi:MAG: SDR family NAD(P)-dependent oxidoreductase [Cellvibrionaceae bacterium]